MNVCLILRGKINTPVSVRKELKKMQFLQEHDITCPYCGEIITLLIDESVVHQSYVEDCRVCCNPILLDIVFDKEGGTVVNAGQENN